VVVLEAVSVWGAVVGSPFATGAKNCSSVNELKTVAPLPQWQVQWLVRFAHWWIGLATICR
jgi:hypothetical protein